MVALALDGAAGRARRAEQLAAEGISVEVIDPRTVAPLDLTRILALGAQDGRLLIVDEAFGPCGIGAEIAARVADEGFDDPRRADPPAERRAYADAVQPDAGSGRRPERRQYRRRRSVTSLAE